MKTSHKIALAFGLSLIGAGTVAYLRGRTNKELVQDTVLHGLLIGSGFSVAIWLSALNSPEQAVTSMPNPSFLDRALALVNGATRMGNMSKEAVKLLSQVNSDSLYGPWRDSGVKAAPTPDDEYTVHQEP